MDRLIDVRARVHRGRELLDIVSALRSLAALRVRHAAEGAHGIRRYADIVADGLGQALALVPAAPPVPATGSRAVVALCAEHGFVGGFNREVLDLAVAELRRAPGRLVIVGSRGAAIAAERGIAVDAALPMATHRDAIEELVRQLAGELLEAGDARVDLVFHRWGERGAHPAVTPLLPLPLDRFPRPGAATPPLHYLPPAALVHQLAEEYVLAQVALAAIESFASENRTRLHTLERAREAIERRLDELRARERQMRQDEITTELLDVVVGATAQNLRRGP